MAQAQSKLEKRKFRLPLFQGILPVERSKIPNDVLAGLTLAALGSPR